MTTCLVLDNVLKLKKKLNLLSLSIDVEILTQLQFNPNNQFSMY